MIATMDHHAIPALRSAAWIAGQQWDGRMQLERRVAEVEELNAGLSDLVAELLPYSGDSCPGECRYRAECKLPSNQSSTGEPLTCVAYGHLMEKASELGVEVKR